MKPTQLITTIRKRNTYTISVDTKNVDSSRSLSTNCGGGSSPYTMPSPNSPNSEFEKGGNPSG